MKNKIFKLSLIIVITILLSTTIVYATTYLYNSNEVSYNNTNSSLSSTDVQDALDELYTKLDDYEPVSCPSGYTCTNKSNIKCQRVTSSSSLNTVTCEQSSNDCAEVEGNGNTITYGRAKSLGTPLEPGDAFDCKVSTTGGYSERFYYVSDYYDTSTKSFNSDVGVLIYYSNTYNGTASDSGVVYNSNDTNYNGPVTAVTHLPTTTQWNNISLYKTNRQILAENNATSTSGGNLPTTFSYSGKAARLLTYQELYSACYNTTKAISSTGGLNNCNFLFENTNYSSSSLSTAGTWLETPSASSSNVVYIAHSLLRNSSRNYHANNDDYGVRPAIEVLKSDISY